nr:methionine-R-sulfoxide reductase B3 isoform X1 [Rattus norvegicus]
MLIFGLCRPCPGISRHASRRPVCRPEPGGRRDRTAVAPLPRSARWTLPRPIALCLGLCLAAVAATTPRAVAAAFASGCVAEDTTAMSAFNLLHLVTKSQPVALRACGLPSGSSRDKKNCKVAFSQQELRKRLTPLQYHVTQEKGTESAFEGEYTHHKDPGIYKCVVCGTPLFKSETKFDSGSGWPSFHDVISSEAIEFTDDFSYGMHRVETSCSQEDFRTASTSHKQAVLKTMLIGKLAQVQILLQEGNGTTEATEFDVHLVHTFFFFFCLSVCFFFFCADSVYFRPSFQTCFQVQPISQMAPRIYVVRRSMQHQHVGTESGQTGL